MCVCVCVCTMWQLYLFVTYNIIVNYGLLSIYLVILHSSDFICGIYIGIVPLYMH